MASEYYYARDGRQFGPATAAQLKGLADSGQLRPDDLVWKTGMPEWRPASTLKGLFAAAPEAVQAAAPLVAELGPLPRDESARGQSFGNLLGRGVGEVTATARATWGQTVRLFGAGSGKVQERFWRQEAESALAALGRRLWACGAGDPAVREELRRLHRQLDKAQETRASTYLLKKDCHALYLRLAEPFLTQSVPPGAEAEHQQAVAAHNVTRRLREEGTHSRGGLLPADRADRWRVAIGYAAVAFAVLLMFATVFAVYRLAFRSGGSGVPLLSGARDGDKLVGTWEGTTTFFLKFELVLEFKSNGRVSWTQKAHGLPGKDTFTGSGNWKVRLVEGNKYVIDFVNDLAPDDTHGWTATFEGDDQMTLVGFDDIDFKLKRKR